MSASWEPFRSVHFPSSSVDRPGTRELLKEHTCAGRPLLASIEYRQKNESHSNHMVQVQYVYDLHDGEMVSYANPWGRVEEMPLDGFLDLLQCLHFLPQRAAENPGGEPLT